MTYSKPKGTFDIFGSDITAWRFIEDTIRKLCTDFCITEIRTPMYESAELFVRGVGEGTDIVQKEMFTFTDNAERLFALRPEGTAGVARSFIENSMSSNPMPVKVFYIMPVFRAEKPQKGRYRQHHQFGIEYIGAASPQCDAEVISVAWELLQRLGINNIEVHINSIGCPECRKKYNKNLKDFLNENLDKLCPVCRQRFEKNPLRVLDCKNEDCKTLMENAPEPINSLDPECRKHFENVKESLDTLKINYVVDPKLVRGIDYYTRTVFEIISTDLGAQGSVSGGGRYDGLIAQCGGPETPACGFGMGIERLLIILEEQGKKHSVQNSATVFVGHSGEAGLLKSQSLVNLLRHNGVSAENDLLNRSVKSQIKYADKIGAIFSFIIGDDEISKNFVKIKNMSTGEQSEISLDNIINFFKEREACK